MKEKNKQLAVKIGSPIKKQLIEQESVLRLLTQSTEIFQRYLYFKLKELTPDFLYSGWIRRDLSTLFGEKMILYKDEKQCLIKVESPFISDVLWDSKDHKNLQEMISKSQKIADNIIGEIKRLEEQVQEKVNPLKLELENSQLYRYSQSKYILEMMERDEKKKGRSVKISVTGAK